MSTARRMAQVRRALERGDPQTAGALANEHLRPHLTTDPRARYVYALAALQNEDYAEALPIMERVVQDYPKSPKPFYHLGCAYRGLALWRKAADAYAAAVAMDPHHVSSLVQLGHCLRFLGDPNANYAYDCAIKAEPRTDNDRYAQAHVLIAKGHYTEGWRLYEMRWTATGAMAGWDKQLTTLDRAKQWTGRSNPKRLYCVMEQGYGDQIQMARYFPLLAERCERLTVACRASLVTLFQRQADGQWDVIEGKPGPAPDHDAWVASMSLPHVMGTTVDTIPPPADFHIPLDPVHTFVVALCSKGGSGSALDYDRSDRNGALAQALEGGYVVDMTGLTGDWEETACRLSFAGALVTVDTAMMHLGASLGLAVYAVPPSQLEWRWDEREGHTGTPWYPAVRAFRRAHTNDWRTVAQQIREALDSSTVQTTSHGKAH